MTQDDKKALGRMTHKRRGVSPHDLAALSPPTTSQTPAPRQRTWSTRYFENISFFVTNSDGTYRVEK